MASTNLGSENKTVKVQLQHMEISLFVLLEKTYAIHAPLTTWCHLFKLEFWAAIFAIRLNLQLLIYFTFTYGL